MTTLRATRVYHGGPSARAGRPATTSCTLSASGADGTLDLAFGLSRGKGAQAEVVVAIGKADLHLFIQEALALWPEMAPALTAKITTSLATALEQQRAFQATIAKQTLRHLVRVDHALDALAEQELPKPAMRQVFTAGDALEEARGTLEVF